MSLLLAPSRQRRLLPWPCSDATPRRLRRQQKAAHGSSGYGGVALDLLHFVARRRLPAVKRTATMPGCVGHDRQVGSLRSTAPRRAGVNRCAIEHNRALPKPGQSLRGASLGGLALARPAGSGNGRLCLAPRPGQRLFQFAALSVSIQALRAGWYGSLPRLAARSLAGVAGSQLVVKVGAGGAAKDGCAIVSIPSRRSPLAAIICALTKGYWSSPTVFLTVLKQMIYR